MPLSRSSGQSETSTNGAPYFFLATLLEMNIFCDPSANTGRSQYTFPKQFPTGLRFMYGSFSNYGKCLVLLRKNQFGLMFLAGMQGDESPKQRFQEMSLLLPAAMITDDSLRTSFHLCGYRCLATTPVFPAENYCHVLCKHVDAFS